MSFHHRSQFSGRPKAHKNFGKSKPSSANKVSGRLVPETGGQNQRKFQSGFDEHRDIGRSQRQATARERRKKHREAQIQKKLQYYGKIKGGIPKIVALVPLSPFCDLKKIKKSMMRHTNCETANGASQPVFIQSQIGARTINYQLWVCDRNQWSILDICKVADIIVLVGSPSPDLKNHEMLHKAENQHQHHKQQRHKQQQKGGDESNANANENDDGDEFDTYRSHLLGIDSFSKEICQLIRIQGVNNILALYQARFHSDLVSKGQVSKKSKNKYVVSKLDKRVQNHFSHLIKFEFGNDIFKKCKFLDCYDNTQLFRFMSELKHIEIDWREKRPHILADSIQFNLYENKNNNNNNNKDDNGMDGDKKNNNNNNTNNSSEKPPVKEHEQLGQLELCGFLRGGQNWDVSKAVHITGIGDFIVSRVDGQILNRPKKIPQLPSERRKQKKEERRMQNQVNIEKKLAKSKLQNEKNGVNNNNNNNDNKKNSNENIDVDVASFLENDEDEKNNDSNVVSNESMMDNEVEMKTGNDGNGAVGDFINLVLVDNEDESKLSLDKLRPLDDLGTAGDQSIITEEELRQADEKRRQRMLKIMKQKELSKDGLSDYRLDWDELVGWGSGDEDDINDNPNGNDNDLSLTEKLKAIRDNDQTKGKGNNNNNNNNNNDDSDDVKQHNKMIDDNDIDSQINDLTIQAAALHISEKDMSDPVEILAKKKRLEHEEMEFPDEVNTPIHIRAKDKFGNYRGLKSFIRTKWDKFELLPIEYSRIFQITDWKRAKKLANMGFKGNNNNDNDNDDKMDSTYPLIECGRKVRVYIENVPLIVEKLLKENGHSRGIPCLMWGLLDHEHKISVCHFNVTKDLHYDKPVQGLDRYIFDVGFRRFISRPIFSAKSRNDKHLVEKFLQRNEVSVASVYAPIMYPNLPVLMFEHPNTLGKRNNNNNNNKNNKQKQKNSNKNKNKQQNKGKNNKNKNKNKNKNEKKDDGDDDNIENIIEYDDDDDIYDNSEINELNNNSFGCKYLIGNYGILQKHISVVANGSLLEVNAHRLLIKRKILTGYPIRVHRRRAVVRYMFWNADDVRYFMPLDIWTKHGLHGKIEEPVGEKGYMKCFFDSTIKQHDIVCLSLYKRVFPIADKNLFGKTVTSN